VAHYLNITEDISPFDAIDVPADANVCGNNFPKPIDITDDDDAIRQSGSKLLHHHCYCYIIISIYLSLFFLLSLI